MLPTQGLTWTIFDAGLVLFPSQSERIIRDGNFNVYGRKTYNVNESCFGSTGEIFSIVGEGQRVDRCTETRQVVSISKKKTIMVAVVL